MTSNPEEYIKSITENRDPAQPVYVVGDTITTVRLFCRTIGAPPQWRPVIEPERLRGVGPGARILVVDTGTRLRPGMLDILQVIRATVEWISLDRVMGVDRRG